MANLTITKLNDLIKVCFNDYFPLVVPYENVGFYRTNAVYVRKHADCVEVKLAGDGYWWISFDGAGESLQVDEVDGSAPTSNEDLYLKLLALMS